MDAVRILIAVAAGVILFLFGIESFSREIQAVTGERFRRFLARGTRNRFLGFLLGGLVTAVIQSSTATSVIAVGLVNAGVLSFRHSLGIIFGANVGTTVTAQLVALELTAFAPWLILVGFIASYLPFRLKVFGRSIFYFGLVFFSLQMVSAAVAPLKSDPRVLSFFAELTAPSAGVLAGAVFTALVQSSSVTTGVTIILLQQGVIEFPAALPVLLGANVGTTITAMIASRALDTSARRTALSHVLYNVGGVALFFPFLGPFEALLRLLHTDVVAMLATAHLVFNLVAAAVFLAALRPFASMVERLVRDDADEEPLEPPPVLDKNALDRSLQESSAWVGMIAGKVVRYYVAAVLALETRDKKIASRAGRIASIIRYGMSEARELVYKLSRNTMSAEQSRRVLHLVITIDHVGQLMDSVDDIMNIGANLDRRNMRLSMDALLDIQRVYPRTAKLLETLVRSYDQPTIGVPDVRAQEGELADHIHQAYQHFIELARDEREGTDLADFLSVHQRLRSKALAFAGHIAREGPSSATAPPPSEEQEEQR